MKSISRSLVAALTGALLLSIATPVVAGAQGASSATYLYNCSKLTSRPSSIILACADANLYVAKITWSGWSTKNAHAKGTLHWNTCTPTCVSGTMKSAPITFVASGRRLVKGKWLYTQLVGNKSTWRTGAAVFALPTSAL
jgi:hypothetical protein